MKFLCFTSSTQP